MEEFAQELQAELQVDTAFTIPLFGGIDIAESVVVTWIVMAFIVIGCYILGRNLRLKNPGKRQRAAEAAVLFLDRFTGGLLGEEGKEYSVYISTILIFIAIANMIGIIGLKPPTKDMNVTLGLSVMSIVLIEAAGIRKKGPMKWLKGFASPVWAVAPINILEIVIRPLSLCMRLFGNVLGAFIIMELIKMAVPPIVPVPAILSLYFDIFDGGIQAYIFVFLTSLYIKEAVE